MMPRKPLYVLLREPAPPGWTPTVGDRVAVPLSSTLAVAGTVTEVFRGMGTMRVSIPVFRGAERTYFIEDVRPIPEKGG